MTGRFRKGAYPVPVSRASVAEDFKTFTFGVFNDPPGQVWADFVHETDEFVVLAEGEMLIELDGVFAHCVPGDLVLIPAGTRHSLRTAHTAGSTWFYGYGSFGEEHD